jgi:hypothetical protein
VASLIWEPGELHTVQGQTVEALGFGHCFFRYSDTIPEGTDIVLVQGPYGSLRPLAAQLDNSPASTRPVLVYWFGESLQFLPSDFLTRPAAKMFSELTMASRDTRRLRDRNPQSSAGFPFNRGHRLGFLGDIQWLHRRGLLDVLALCSTVYATYLNDLGIDSCVVPRGYHSSYGRLLGSERDVTLLWMGKPRSKRRWNWITQLRRELESRGEIMHVYDGVENAFIYGEQRTQLLNRAKFVLNLNAYGPQDELSIRYFIAAANGAVVLSEPNANQYPFIPGKHLVECRPEEMVEVIAYYQRHPSEREQIAAAMHEYIRTELTLSNSIKTILDRACSIWLQRQRKM